MAQGKRTPPETVYLIMTSWAETNSYTETARLLGLPESTVEKIVKSNREDPDFVKLCVEKRTEFAEKASQIVGKGMTLLNRRLDRALEQEMELDKLIDEVYDMDKEELSFDEKKRLISTLRNLQLQDIRAVTQTVGTMFDKKALAEGKPTENVSIEIKLPDGVDEYAG